MALKLEFFTAKYCRRRSINICSLHIQWSTHLGLFSRIIQTVQCLRRTAVLIRGWMHLFLFEFYHIILRPIFTRYVPYIHTFIDIYIDISFFFFLYFCLYLVFFLRLFISLFFLSFLSSLYPVFTNEALGTE
jgi:hypothetical protein